MSNMKNNTSSVKKFGLEIFSIVFAVLLALTLDSWQEQSKQQKKINKALNDIVEEIYTFSTLNGALEYNKSQLDSLNMAIEKHKSGEEANFNFGLGRPEIKSLTWQISKENGITSSFDRTLLLEIAEVYVEYDRLMKTVDYYVDFRLKSDPDISPYTEARYSSRYISSAIFRIGELIRKANDFLERHKNESFVKALHQN